MKTVQEIDPKKEMDLDDFLVLFSHLPLNEAEVQSLEENYYNMYQLFIAAGTEPVDAWLATRNTFTARETQVGQRLRDRGGNIGGVARKETPPD